MEGVPGSEGVSMMRNQKVSMIDSDRHVFNKDGSNDCLHNPIPESNEKPNMQTFHRSLILSWDKLANLLNAFRSQWQSQYVKITLDSAQRTKHMSNTKPSKVLRLPYLYIKTFTPSHRTVQFINGDFKQRGHNWPYWSSISFPVCLFGVIVAHQENQNRLAPRLSAPISSVAGAGQSQVWWHFWSWTWIYLGGTLWKNMWKVHYGTFIQRYQSVCFLIHHYYFFVCDVWCSLIFPNVFVWMTLAPLQEGKPSAQVHLGTAERADESPLWWKGLLLPGTPKKNACWHVVGSIFNHMFTVYIWLYNVSIYTCQS